MYSFLVTALTDINRYHQTIFDHRQKEKLRQMDGSLAQQQEQQQLHLSVHQTASRRDGVATEQQAVARFTAAPPPQAVQRYPAAPPPQTYITHRDIWVRWLLTCGRRKGGGLGRMR